MGKLKQSLIDTDDEQLDMPSPDYELIDDYEDDQDSQPYDFWDNDEEILKKVEE